MEFARLVFTFGFQDPICIKLKVLARFLRIRIINLLNSFYKYLVDQWLRNALAAFKMNRSLGLGI